MIEKKYNFLLIILLAIVGCAKWTPFHPKVMNSWIGAHQLTYYGMFFVDSRGYIYKWSRREL